MEKKHDFEEIIKICMLGVLLFFILYPIFAIMGGIILAILHIILGGNGDLGTALIETAGFAWVHWEITLLILFILAIFLQYRLKEDTSSKYYEIKEKLTHPELFAKKAKRRNKSGSKEINKEIIENKAREIESFFEALQRKKEQITIDYQTGVVLDDANYNMFYSFINKIKESLHILCWRVDEKLLSEILWPLRHKNIVVIVVTKNRTNKGYLKEFKNYCPNLKLELVHRNKIHAKMIIKDKRELTIGSSNITESSISQSGHFLDCNTISNHKETVQNAIDLFKSVYEKKDYMQKIENSKLMYSRNSQDCLPFSLKPYFEQETEEILLLFSCDMVDKRIVDRIVGWNSKTPIKIYVGDSFKTSGLSKDNLSSMKWLYDTSITNYSNICVIPINDDVHAKLYLFKNQERAFISSQNLTVESWQSLLEAGIICNDKKEFKYLYDSLISLKKSCLSKIDMGDLEGTNKPESTFSGTDTEKSIKLPWDLPEADNNWKIPRSRNQEYFNLVKKKPKDKKGVFSEDVGKRGDSKKIEKSHLLEELEESYLKKQAITGLYSKPTRHILTGKSPKKRTRWEWETEKEKLKKKLETSKSEQEKNKINEGIKYCEEIINKLDE